LVTSVKKITNVVIIADPFSKNIWAGVPPLMYVIKIAVEKTNMSMILKI
jgi:hypothetical protein